MSDVGRPLTIIIPAYNEEETIVEVINNLVAECGDFVAEFIVIDDGSTDLTASLVKTTQARLICHHQNRGYGAALKTGIRAAQTEFVVTVDSDGQHKASFVKLLWDNHGEHDMMVGA